MALQSDIDDARNTSAPSAADETLIFPCTASQLRAWFMNQLDPGTPALNVALRWELRGRFDPRTIEAAFQKIIARHEILRTRFVEVEGAPQQEVQPTVPFRMSLIDLSQLAEAEQKGRIVEIGRSAASQSFDLASPPLIRVTLARLSESRAMLFPTIHQIAFDGWSIKVLGRELGVIASSLDARIEPELPELPIQYGDFARWQQAYFASTAFQAEIDYWRAKLADAPYLEIPPDRPRPAKSSGHGDMVSMVLPKELGERFEALAQRRNDSHFSVGSAAIATALHSLSGSDDIVIGTQVAGRNDVDLENLIGMFINTLAFRFDLKGDPTIAEHLDRVAHTVREAIVNEQMPFQKLVEILNPPRVPGRPMLISVNFVVLRAFMDDKKYGDFELVGLPSQTPGVIYDLSFIQIRRPDGWRITVEYNEDLFTRKTAEQILDLWRRAIELVAGDQNARVSALAPPERLALGHQTPPHLAAAEAALAGHPGVGDVAIVEALDPAGKAAGYAYVVPADNFAQPLDELADLLADTLEASLPVETARPAGYALLLKLPRDENGALRVEALPPPRWPRARGGLSAGHAPSPEIEAKLVEIWRAVLEQRHLDRDSNFFEHGGHSILAVRAIARIASDFNVRPDIVTLFRAPTPHQYARVVAELLPRGEAAAAPRGQHIVEVQSEGDGVPLIGFNTVATLFSLSLVFGEKRRCICVRVFDDSLPDAEKATFPRRPMEEIAADYVALVRRAQPHGPYVLFGICVHATIAFETARQLRAQGEDAIVVMVDCWEPQYAGKLPFLQALHLRYFMTVMNFRRVLRGGISLTQFFARYRIVHWSGVLKLLAWLKVISHVPPRTGDQRQDAFLRYLNGARDAYRPEPYDGEVIYFLTDYSPKGPGYSTTLGWDAHLKGPLKVIEIAGLGASQINQPGLEDLSRSLEELFARLEGRDKAGRPEASAAAGSAQASA